MDELNEANEMMMRFLHLPPPVQRPTTGFSGLARALRLPLAFALLIGILPTTGQAQHVIPMSKPATSTGSVTGPSAALKYLQKPGLGSAGATVGRKSIKASGASSASKSKKKKTEKKKSDPHASLSSRAAQELELTPQEQTPTVIETPATVRTTLAKKPELHQRSSLELGLSAQLIRPEGKGRVTGFEPYDLSALGTQPMPALELRWQPFKWERMPLVRAGGFASIGYAQHSVELRGPTGFTLDQALLHTTKLEAGLALSRAFESDPRWSLRGQLGGGRVDMIQSSKTPDANQSGYLLFVSAGGFVEHQTWERVGLFAGYENRLAFSKSEPLFDLPRHNWLIGAWGSFQ